MSLPTTDVFGVRGKNLDRLNAVSLPRSLDPFRQRFYPRSDPSVDAGGTATLSPFLSIKGRLSRRRSSCVTPGLVGSAVFVFRSVPDAMIEAGMRSR